MDNCILCKKNPKNKYDNSSDGCVCVECYNILRERKICLCVKCMFLGAPKLSLAARRISGVFGGTTLGYICSWCSNGP
jgi:hypothetical protein